MPPIDFCRMIAEIITSPDNQHVTMMITATTGAGKSYAGISIAERVSQIVAEIKGGYPEDYFSVDNIAVITQNEILRVMHRMNNQKYMCFGFDDIGAVGWNSRNFMQTFNQQLNSIFQTFRTQNNFLYLTLPNDMLIDIVPRSLTKYQMKITASHFEFGYVEAKVFKPIKDSKLPHGRIEPFLQDLDGQKIKRHIIFKPSKYLTDEYDTRRSEIESKNTGMTIEAMLHSIESEGDLPKPRPTKKEILLEPIKIDYDNGNGLSMAKIAQKYKISPSTVHKILHSTPS